MSSAVEHFREAAILPERWPAALQALADALRSDGATLVVTPTRAHSIVSSENIRPILADYFTMRVADPRETRVTPAYDQGFVPDFAYFSRREITRDPYYQEFLVPRGFGWNATANLGSNLLLGLKRHVSRGPYEAKELTMLNRVLPAMRSASRAARLAWQSNFSGQLQAFELMGRGAVLLGEEGRVLGGNACVKFGDTIDVSGGILQATRHADRGRLHAFVNALLAPPDVSSAQRPTLALPRPHGQRPLLLDGIGCGEALRSRHSDALALIIITDVERSSGPSSDLLQRLFGLTTTEAKIAGLLAAGKALQEVSILLAISEGHARQRLKAIFQKTGTARQGQLISLLARLT